MLANEPELLQKEPFAKVKVFVADFDVLEKEDRMRYVLTEVQRNFNLGDKRGVNYFERTLGTVGLSGEVDEKTRETLWLANHYRNVIVHRRSRADRTFVRACPHLGMNVGDEVLIDRETYARLAVGIYEYGLNLTDRLGIRYDVEMGSSSISEGHNP